MSSSRRSREITAKMAWLLFWMSTVASLVLVIRANEELWALALAVMAASIVWVAGCQVMGRLQRAARGRRRAAARATYDACSTKSSSERPVT